LTAWNLYILLLQSGKPRVLSPFGGGGIEYFNDPDRYADSLSMVKINKYYMMF